jgi:hypothetical protein
MNERWYWLFLSIVGALFYGMLLLNALRDMRLRRSNRHARKSSILLAWHRIALDAVMCGVMLLDCYLAWLSFTPGNGSFVIFGLVADKVALVVLSIYLLFNRHWTKEAADEELAGEGQVPVTRTTFEGTQGEQDNA